MPSSPATIWRAKRAASLGGTAMGTTETVFLNALPSGTTTPCIAYIPGDSKQDTIPITITAAGKVTGGTTTNFTVKLYSGSSATVGSDTQIATSGAVAVNSASGNYRLVFEGVVDKTSKTLQGIFYGHVNGTAVAQTIHSNAPTIDPTGADAPFVVSATFSASNSGNVATLDSFTVQAD